MVRCPGIVTAGLLGIGLLMGQAARPTLAQFADVQEGAAPAKDAAEAILVLRGAVDFARAFSGDHFYERDLGDDTALLATAIQEYNLDSNWRVAKE
jgi:hypothetical protein